MGMEEVEKMWKAQKRVEKNEEEVRWMKSPCADEQNGH